MSQLWAIVTPTGDVMLRYTEGADQHPATCGCADECAGNAVWPIARPPRGELGESVDGATGAFDFDLARVRAALVAGVKAEAGRRIDAVAPLWQQINDLRDPAATGAAARSALITAIREYSNAAETAIDAVGTADGLQAVLDTIAQGWPT